MSKMNVQDPAADLLEGIEQIAAFTGMKPRRASYLLAQGVLPAGRMGTRWVASRRRLRLFCDRITLGTADPAERSIHANTGT